MEKKKKKGREEGERNGRRGGRKARRQKWERNKQKLKGRGINLSSSMLLLLSHDFSERKKTHYVLTFLCPHPDFLGNLIWARMQLLSLPLLPLQPLVIETSLGPLLPLDSEHLCLLTRFSEFEAQILYLRIISGHHLHAHIYKFWSISKGQGL